MKQMDLPEGMKEKIDFSDTTLPFSVRVLKPLLFKDGDSYCVILGPDPSSGVFGCGKTANEALIDWSSNLKERIKHADANDEMVNYIRNAL